MIEMQYTKGCENSLNEICSRVTVRAKEDHVVNIVKPNVAYICTTLFLEELAKYLGENPDSEIDLGSLIKFSTTQSDSAEAEKAGSIVPKVELGERFKLAVKSDGTTEEDEDE